MSLARRLQEAYSADGLSTAMRFKHAVSGLGVEDFNSAYTDVFPSQIDGMKAEFLSFVKREDGYQLRIAAQQEGAVGFETWKRTGGWVDRPLNIEFDVGNIKAALLEPKGDESASYVQTWDKAVDLLKTYENGMKEKGLEPIDDEHGFRESCLVSHYDTARELLAQF